MTGSHQLRALEPQTNQIGLLHFIDRVAEVQIGDTARIKPRTLGSVQGPLSQGAVFSNH